AAGEPVLIDVFEGGKEMSRAEANKRVEALAERPARDDDFAPVTRRQIVVRVLTNLLSLARNERDPDGMLRYLDAIVDLTPEPGRERWMRAVVASQTGRPERARADVDWLLEKEPAGVNLDQVRELKRVLERTGP